MEARVSTLKLSRACCNIKSKRCVFFDDPQCSLIHQSVITGTKFHSDVSNQEILWKRLCTQARARVWVGWRERTWPCRWSGPYSRGSMTKLGGTKGVGGGGWNQVGRTWLKLEGPPVQEPWRDKVIVRTQPEAGKEVEKKNTPIFPFPAPSVLAWAMGQGQLAREQEGTGYKSLPY